VHAECRNGSSWVLATANSYFIPARRWGVGLLISVGRPLLLIYSFKFRSTFQPPQLDCGTVGAAAVLLPGQLSYTVGYLTPGRVDYVFCYLMNSDNIFSNGLVVILLLTTIMVQVVQSVQFVCRVSGHK